MTFLKIEGLTATCPFGWATTIGLRWKAWTTHVQGWQEELEDADSDRIVRAVLNAHLEKFFDFAEDITLRPPNSRTPLIRDSEINLLGVHPLQKLAAFKLFVSARNMNALRRTTKGLPNQSAAYLLVKIVASTETTAEIRISKEPLVLQMPLTDKNWEQLLA